MTAGGSDAVESPIRIGISACLLGEEVRQNGGHKRAEFLIDAFSQSVQWVPICPEVEAGFATPREPKFPTLPVEEEGRLADPRLLAAFVERVRAYHRATKNTKM